MGGPVAWVVLVFPQYQPMAKARLRGTIIRMALVTDVLQVAYAYLLTHWTHQPSEKSAYFL